MLIMSDLLDENLVPFAAGIRSLPGRPSLSAGYRFALKTVHGVQLETIVVGGRRFTSKEALRRFVAATTRAANQRAIVTPPTSSAQCPELIDRLDSALDERGL